jgi:regulator of protease activity HflC (stomatin/prohibitin superfamily)
MASLTTSLLCVLAFIFVTLLFLLANAVRVVAEYHRLVVFRLGRCTGAKGPGLVFIIPFIDRGVKVDLREQKRVETRHPVILTKENISVTIRYAWSFKVVDPVASVTQVGNFEQAAVGIGVTSLRSMVAGIKLVELLTRREQLAQLLRTKLDEVTEKWGVKVTAVEFEEINPPKDIQEAVDKQVAEENIRQILDSSLTGLNGVTRTIVHLDGKVQVAGQNWDAVSPSPILPEVNIRVRRVILEVEKDQNT